MKKQSERVLVLSAIVAMAAISCVSAEAPSGEEAPLPAAAAIENGGKAALRIERAARSLDRGEDASRARTEMDAVIADAATTAAERDDARLVLSRALEAMGDREGAISEVERLLESHAADREWAASKEAEKRLRKLLTGKDGDPRPRLSSTGPVAAIASELMPFFPPDPAGTVHFRMFSFGGERARSEKIGTFNVPESIRQSRGKSCPTCRNEIDSQTQTHGWVGIPQHRSELGNALVVFYFDLEENRIPARYDALLPMPSADIVARLSKGEGLVAVKERAGAPPVILIAAPRFALLDDVESELAKMNKLPAAPTAITLPGSLEAEEVQDIVRASFGEFRGCYENRLQQDPAAAGKISLDFHIEPDGHVTNEKAIVDNALTSMESCMLDATRKLVFPAAPKMTSVVYPVEFSPGD